MNHQDPWSGLLNVEPVMRLFDVPVDAFLTFLH